MNNQDPFFIPAPGENDGGFTKELITAGSHQAVCCQLHNVGYQMFKNEISRSPKAVIVFELDQKMTGGKMAGQPMVISESYPMYMGDGSKLRVAMEGWRGAPYKDAELKNFSLGGALRRPCTLLIIHVKKQDGTMKAKIAGILPPMGPGWAPTYTETPEWILKEKAQQVHPQQAPAAPTAHPSQAVHQTPQLVPAAPGGFNPATHDAQGEKLPF